ncbi:VOC family protein [Aeromonas rivipollensis]|uniref:VOC family protein n=1 Tax=Aeromonas rivipollensis TaxID=948519 RepID=UPI001F20F1F5|nr:VOC family protein [Aeromonas rivipollensis]MCE9957642.1 VOC family protein [Aeromonas rivipollensis]
MRFLQKSIRNIATPFIPPYTKNHHNSQLINTSHFDNNSIAIGKGIPCLGLNGGPGVSHSWAFSFQVATKTQAETDRYWHAIIDNGGQASECGWCQDKWGISWQITPLALTEAITDPDPEAARRAFEAMMQMGKIDIAAIEAARRG